MQMYENQLSNLLYEKFESELEIYRKFKETYQYIYEDAVLFKFKLFL